VEGEGEGGGGRVITRGLSREKIAGAATGDVLATIRARWHRIIIPVEKREGRGGGRTARSARIRFRSAARARRRELRF